MRIICFLLTLCCLLASVAIARDGVPVVRDVQTSRYFAMNVGQWDARILASSMLLGPTVSLSRSGYAVALSGEGNAFFGETASPRFQSMQLVNVSASCEVRASGTAGPPLRYIDTRVSPARETLSPAFTAVSYANAWKGIDVTVAGDVNRLRHEIRVAAGADPSQLRLRFDNVEPGALRILSSDAYVAPVLKRTADGAMELTLGGYVRPFSFAVNLEFVLFHGGTDREYSARLRVDRCGNLRVSGTTRSPDFPLYNAIDPSTQYTQAMVDVKMSPEGELLHSTVVSVGTGAPSILTTTIGIEDSHVFLIRASTALGSMLTPDAHYTTASPYAFFVFDNSGKILYVSYIQSDLLQEIVDMDSNPCGNVYVLAHTYYTPPMVTPDALFPVKQGTEDGFVMKFSSSDNFVLTYATCIGGMTHDEFSHIAVSDEGEVAVIGTTSGQGYPAVNAAQATPGGGRDYVLSKISSDGSRLVFSTYLGGSGNEIFNRNYSRNLTFDSDGNLYFIGSTSSTDFPLVNPIQNQRRGNSDLVLCRYSREGTLTFSTYFGGNGTESPYELDVDDCGRMILTGLFGSSDLPLVNSMFPRPITTGTASFVSVVDAVNSALLFSSWYGSRSLCSMRMDGYSVFMATISDGTMLQPTPGRQGANPVGGDIAVSRLDFPAFCERRAIPSDVSLMGPEIAVSMQLVDTVRIDTLRNVMEPMTIIIDVVVSNLDSSQHADSLHVTVTMPSIFTFMHGIQEIMLPILQPNASFSFQSVYRASLEDLRELKSFRAAVRATTRGLCPRTASVNKTVYIIFHDIGYREAMCWIDIPDPPVASLTGLRLENDSMFARVHVSNFGDDIAPLTAIHLELSPGSGLLPFDSHPLQRTLMSIPPHTDIEMEFLFRVLSWQFDREVTLTATLFDNYNQSIITCEILLMIPGVKGTVCSISSPPSVLWDPVHAVSTPERFDISMMIENPSDTIRFYHIDRIEFDAAPHLALAAGEEARRDRFFIKERFRRSHQWFFVVRGPLDNDVTQTVRFVYVTESDSTEHFCDATVRITVQRDEVICLLLVPDSLALDATSGRLEPSAFNVTAVLHNVGNTTHSLKQAVIHLPTDGMLELLDARAKGLRQLAPNERDSVSWSLQAKSGLFERESELIVTIHDPEDEEVSRCEATTFIPAGSLRCDLHAPDSIIYDVLNDEYIPAVFDVVSRVTNATDSAVTAIEVSFEAASLRRSRLLDPGTVVRIINRLEPWTTDEVRWTLEALWADRPEDENFAAEVTVLSTDLRTTCAALTHIGGQARDLSAQCAVAGHDTVWADSFYETLIPDPIQVRYTLHNTGTVILRGCEVAIIPPRMFLLAAGEDSIRLLPDVLPGEYVHLEWILEIQHSEISPGTSTIRWQSSCLDLESIEECDMQVTLVDHAPFGVVLTPWSLRFQATRNGPLPVERKVSIWTGGGPTPEWRMLVGIDWLNASPDRGAAFQRMNVQPNTTDLEIGTHSGVLVFDVEPVSTGNIQVWYDIHTTLRIGERVHAGSSQLAVYPNPLTRGATATILHVLAPGKSGIIELRDVLGRSLRLLHVDSGGIGTSRIDTGNLAPGVYFVTLRVGAESESRLLVIME